MALRRAIPRVASLFSECYTSPNLASLQCVSSALAPDSWQATAYAKDIRNWRGTLLWVPKDQIFIQINCVLVLWLELVLMLHPRQRYWVTRSRSRCVHGRIGVETHHYVLPPKRFVDFCLIAGYGAVPNEAVPNEAYPKSSHDRSVGFIPEAPTGLPPTLHARANPSHLITCGPSDFFAVFMD
jgi:hypothetical protein